LVETYAIKINQDLHKEVLRRYENLNIAPYKGFLNARMTPVRDGNGEITDIELDYSESLAQQMLRYSRDYSVE
jgi:dipeptidyl-peptidase-3